MAKASVSTIQEYCAKHKLPPPVYDCIDSSDGSFICRIEFVEMEAHGNGRSKRDAKHHAAANMIKKLRLIRPDDLPDIAEMGDTVMRDDECPTQDVIVILLDYCIQHQHPLPIIEIVQQAGTPNAPEFTALCQVATIRRYGVSEKKKDAKQKAAFEMLHAIMLDDKLDRNQQVATLAVKTEEVEEDRYFKFKTYREYRESKTGDVKGVLLCDRHNFFTKFYDELKLKAHEVLQSDDYETDKAKALELFDALKIKPRIKELPTQSAEPLVFIELDCEYDVVFAGLKSKVYLKVINYFKDMII